MKKIIMSMRIVVVLSFLVSMIAVAPLFAVEATKTGPTPRQAPTQKTPPPSQFSKNKVMVHTKFWDLAVYECALMNNNRKLCDYFVQIQPELLMISCTYDINTPPTKEITEADAGYWGKGNKLYTLTAVLVDVGSGNKVEAPAVTKALPTFTWDSVQHWRQYEPNNPHNWHFTIDFNLDPAATNDGMNRFYFEIVGLSNEYDSTNNKCSGTILIAP